MNRHSVMAAWFFAFMLSPFCARAAQEISTASYRAELVENGSWQIRVHATLPAGGASLTMATSRPANVAEVADAGWPGLIRNLLVADAEGNAVGATSAGAGGWTLDREVSGPITLQYEVDYRPLAKSGWPAQREAAYADRDHLVVIGRSLFITTPVQQRSEVRFSLPRGWRPVLPWPATSKSTTHAVAASTDDLTENLLAFVNGAPDVLSVGGFNLKVISLGQWRPAREEVRQVLSASLKRLVATIGFDGQADYLVVLLPQSERGGESFRASFALNSDEAPSRANRGRWGNLITHEIFHYWNGWRLRGADYASSQWFQEGMTEYVANLAMVSSGMIEPVDFHARLATHFTNYRRLATPLDAPGTRKGPPLYSGGALVAFIWDETIRERSGGERNLGDMLRALFRRTGDGARPYEWSDIQAALETVAEDDWAEFHARFIHGTEPLPVSDTLSRLGLVMSRGAEGEVFVEVDPAAAEAAHVRRREMLSDRK